MAEYERGHRMLYVALTRSTKYLSVVHHGPVLPGVVGLISPNESRGDAPALAISTAPSPPAPTDTIMEVVDPRPSSSLRLVRAVAVILAEQIIEVVPLEHWPAMLAQLAEDLGVTAGGQEIGEAEGEEASD